MTARAVQDVLDRLEGASRSGSGWMARCPAHEDGTPSLSISEGDKGVVFHCHAGCDQTAVVQALGIPPEELFFDHGTPNGNGRARPEIVATYDYVDEDGGILFQVVRFNPKDFRQRRPDGRGGWEWKLDNTRRVLFDLPGVVEAVALERAVYVVEGEKDVLRLQAWGLAATTCPGGAGKGKWRTEYSESLKGARVVILPDNDEPGREHARQVAESLAGVAEEVCVLHLPGLPVKGDVSDWIDAGGTPEELERLRLGAIPGPIDASEAPTRTLPAPMGVSALLDVEEPSEEWLVEGLIPAGGNVLQAGYPKTFKTMTLLELGVALASGTPFMGRFPVPLRRRVGIVLMEDQAHRVRWRLKRLCSGRGIALQDLDGWLHFWFRPPLRLNDQTAVELAEYAGELDLDFLGVDSWSYVASGDSNSSDDVTPQLQALSHARVKRPGLTVQLTHHARKDMGKTEAGTRLTDDIRNSGAFGAWYDAGLVLSRKDESSPVTVRAELRDFSTPEPFAFEVRDEDPAGPHNGFRSGGWLRLQVSDHRPELVDRMAAVEKLTPAVLQFLGDNPGCSKRAVREGVTGKAGDLDAALEKLARDGVVNVLPPQGKGKPSKIILIGGAE